MKRLKTAEAYIEAKEDYIYEKEHCLDVECRAYELAVRDIKKDLVRLDDRCKTFNGWQHKMEIMDRDIRKIKDKLSEPKG
jgi:hypothetical protein